jgi:multisubunit Na+/H+ antiporter MnhE subunit
VKHHPDIRRVEWFLLIILFSHLVLGAFLASWHHHYFQDYYVREDGPIEWFTMLSLFGGAFICFRRALLLRRQKDWLFLAALTLLGFVFLFGAGEEINWGQRMLNTASPDFFIKYNSQGETNLHNLVVDGVKINKLIFGLILGIVVASYLVFLPILYKFFAPIRRFANRLAIPVPRLHHVIGYVLIFILYELTFSPKHGELLEFGGCMMFLIIVYRPKNHEIFQITR